MALAPARLVVCGQIREDANAIPVLEKRRARGDDPLAGAKTLEHRDVMAGDLAELDAAERHPLVRRLTGDDEHREGRRGGLDDGGERNGDGGRGRRRRARARL
jgi:hypothetical protein